MLSDFYELILDSIYDGIYHVDADRKITYWNKAAEYITGYAKEEVTGRCCSDNILRHIDREGHDSCISGCPLHATLTDSQSRETNIFFHHKNGHRVPVRVKVIPIFNDKGVITGAVEIFTDKTIINDEIKELEQLKKEIYFDFVTGAANRKYAEILLSKHFDTLNIPEKSIGLIFFDIDNFKDFNDNFGHETGDRVLKIVTQTIKNTLRTIDTISRWGGDEFIIIVPNISFEILGTITERIRSFVENSWFTHNNNKIIITISAGATLNVKGDTVLSFIKRADQLMYKSKSNGKNQVTF